MIVYRGNRLIRGHGLGNIFGSLFRYSLPILKKAGTYLGSKLFSLGAETLKDMNKGKKFRESLRDRSLKTRDEIVQETKAKIKKKLAGKGRKRLIAKGFPFGSVSKKFKKKRKKTIRKTKKIKKTKKRQTKKRKKPIKKNRSIKRKLLF